MKPAAADTGPAVTSSVAVCAENLLTNGPVSARGLTFAATAQEDLLTVGVLLTPGTSSGRAWDTTMVAAKGDQELDPEYVAFIRTQLDDSLRNP